MKILFFLMSAQLLFAKFVTAEIQGQLANQLFQTAMVISYGLDHGHEARFPSLKRALNHTLNIEHVFHRLNVSDFPTETQFIEVYEKSPLDFTEVALEAENLRFHGYFCFMKYFEHHADVIKALFAPKAELVEQIYEKYGHLMKGPTVALHIRTFFGDAIDPNQGVGRTRWNYFLRAIDYFPEKYTFLIFSDAPDYVKTHFPQPSRSKIHFVEGNPHYFDFYMISLCDHQILSPKSTFAWWAAWLNPNPDKIVLRPIDDWLPDDAFPPSWIKIEMD